MNDIQDFFLCESCSNKDFRLVYNFSIRFHRVNFSDGLIYDQSVEEYYQCTECRKTYTKKDIENGLAEIKKKRKAQA